MIPDPKVHRVQLEHKVLQDRKGLPEQKDHRVLRVR